MTWSYVKTTMLNRLASSLSGNRTVEARWCLAAHLEDGKHSFQTAAVLRIYPLVEKISGNGFQEASGVKFI